MVRTCDSLASISDSILVGPVVMTGEAKEGQFCGENHCIVIAKDIFMGRPLYKKTVWECAVAFFMQASHRKLIRILIVIANRAMSNFYFATAQSLT